jgi:hypothetical protein
VGSLYRPKYAPAGMSYAEAKAAGLLRESEVWWLKYRVNGRVVRESSGTTSYEEAKRLLKLREGRAAEGRPVAPHADRVTVAEAGRGPPQRLPRQPPPLARAARGQPGPPASLLRRPARQPGDVGGRAGLRRPASA